MSTPVKRSPVDEAEEGSEDLPDPPEPLVLVLNEEGLWEVVECAHAKTQGWTLHALEKLAGRLIHTIQRYAGKWNREGLVEDLRRELEDIQSCQDV